MGVKTRIISRVVRRPPISQNGKISFTSERKPGAERFAPCPDVARLFAMFAYRVLATGVWTRKQTHAARENRLPEDP